MTWRSAAGRAAAVVAGLLPARAGLRALLYHAVGGGVPYDGDYGMSVDPAAFAEQLDALLAAGLLPSRLDAPVAETSAVTVTFDDGFADVLTNAAPLLVERRMPFTVFVTTDWIGRAGYLSADGVRELASVPGAALGTHSASHPRLTTCGDDELRREVAGSRAALEDVLGVGVDRFAYPHGDVDVRVREAVSAAGYRLATTSRYGVNRPDRDPLLLRRIEVVAHDRIRDVTAKATGAWDWRGLLP